jgi:hypothetical protein
MEELAESSKVLGPEHPYSETIDGSFWPTASCYYMCLSIVASIPRNLSDLSSDDHNPATATPH